MGGKISGKSGIYLITSKQNGKQYVGSTINLAVREYQHLWSLKKGDHENGHLQNHYNKHGDVFEFSVLKYCHEDYLIWWEQYHIDTINPEFNICRTAASTLGVEGLKGEKSPRTSLTNKQASAIKQQINEGVPCSEIAETYDVRAGVIRGIKCETAWSSVEPKITNNPKPKLTKQEVSQIKQQLNDGILVSEISELWERGLKTIHSIQSEESHCYVEPKIIKDNLVKKKKLKENSSKKTYEMWKNPEYRIKMEPLLNKMHKGNKKKKKRKGIKATKRKGKKLTRRKVSKIKKLINNGIKCGEIAKMYNVSSTTIVHIKCGKTWHLIGPKITARTRHRFTKEKISDIKQDINKGLLMDEIVKKHDIGSKTAYEIKNGSTHADIKPNIIRNNPVYEEKLTQIRIEKSLAVWQRKGHIEKMEPILKKMHEGNRKQ